MVVAGPPSPRDIKFRKLFVHRDQLGLDNDDLREIAEYLLRRDVPTLSALDETQIERLLDGLELAGMILHLRGD